MQNAPAPARPALLGIAHDGPVIVESHSPRFTWTVQPEDFPALIERVNTYGGPDFWTITPA